MMFEFDLQKSSSNRDKHKIDFIEGQKLFYDPRLIIVQARTEDEVRYLAIGIIDNKHWSAIVTIREERIRIISIRRSRSEEVLIYES